MATPPLPSNDRHSLPPRRRLPVRPGVLLAACGLATVALLHFGLRAAGRPDALLARVWDGVVLAAFLASALALGGRALRLLRVELDLAPRLLASLAVGLAIDSLVGVGLALVHLYRPALLVVVIFAPLLLLRDADRRDCRQAVGLLREALRGVAGILILAFVALDLALAASPASGIDALAYHLVGPRECLAHGGIPPETANPLTFLPPAGDALFGLVMAAGSDFVPKLVHLAFLLLTVAAVGTLARGRVSRTTGVIACLLFLGQWECIYGAQHDNVDFNAAFYGLLALGLALDWVQRRVAVNFGHAVLLGLLLGTAMATKYTALYAVLGVEVVLLAGLGRRRFPAQAFLIANGVAFLALAPMLWRNFTSTGDPLFPFLSGALGIDRIYTPGQLAAWQSMLGIYKPRITVESFFLMPIWALLHAKYPTVSFDGHLDAWALLGPLAALLLLRRRRWLALLYAFLGVFYVAWLGTAILRYAIPVFAVAALLTAMCVEELPERLSHPRWRDLVRLLARAGVYGFAAYGLVSYAWRATPLVVRGVPAFLGLEDRRAYLDLSKSGMIVHLDDFLATRASPTDRIFAVLADESYYLHRFMKSDPTRTNIVLLRDAADPVDWLRTAGYRYVLVDFGRYRWLNQQSSPIPELNPYPEAMTAFRDLWGYFARDVAPRLTPVAVFDTYRLYEVPAAPATPRREP